MEDVQVSVESTEGLTTRIRVQVPAARVEREVEAKLKSLTGTVNLKGFRPGKVPDSVIRGRFGEQARREVIQEVVQSCYAEAVERVKLRPLGDPRIEIQQDPGSKESDLVFTASFDTLPAAGIQGLGEMAVTRPELVIDDADMTFVIEELRKQRGTPRSVDRQAREGDCVTISYSGRVDGLRVDGISRDQVSIELGAGKMGAAFEKQLIGIRVGEERAVKAALSGELASPGLAGRQADFTVLVSNIAEVHLPDVDATFIRSFDIPSGNRDEFMQRIREYMRDEFESRAGADVKRQLLDFLLMKNPVNVPADLVETEARTLQADAARNADMNNVQPAPTLESYRDTAERRVRLGLLFSTITREHGLVVDRERIRARIDQLASGHDKPDEVRNLHYQTPTLLSQVESQVLIEQVVQWLTERATVTPVPTNFRSLKVR